MVCSKNVCDFVNFLTILFFNKSFETSGLIVLKLIQDHLQTFIIQSCQGNFNASVHFDMISRPVSTQTPSNGECNQTAYFPILGQSFPPQSWDILPLGGATNVYSLYLVIGCMGSWRIWFVRSRVMTDESAVTFSFLL